MWAYSIAGLEHWKAKEGELVKLGWNDTVVAVALGTYPFIHHAGERGFNRDAAEAVTFGHVERIT
ncbi:hypothetical protein ACODT5_01190 [Streptomyces sp. 5.8]|uniref:hypothetical protein n=1 Tax=Streptomyces sp. 5.8 TaxID=3406571 RepID=UPI003BB5DCD8